MSTDTLDGAGSSVTASSPATPGPGEGSPAPVIEVRGLTVSYGSRRVLDELDLRVERGEIFGILGPNGAGKTTLVEALQGLRPADGGTLEVLGLDPSRDSLRLRRRIGSQLQSAALPERLRVGEAVRLFARLAGDVVDWRELMESWALGPLGGTAFRSLSGGERQRVFLALALVGRPEVVFLDELTQGLDPLARRATWRLIERIRAAGATVILVSHHMDEVQALCDRVGLLTGGRLCAVGAPDELIACLGGGGVRISFSLDRRAAAELLPPLRELEAVEDVRTLTLRGRTTVEIRGRDAIGVAVAVLLDRLGHHPANLRIDAPTLEDVIVDLGAGEHQGRAYGELTGTRGLAGS